MPTESPTALASSHPERERARVLAARAAHWTRTRRLTGLLLALWLATGFGTVFFARDLAHLSVFGWPLSFYLAAQGASLIYLAIIGAYAWRMRILDRAFARELGEAA
jgi:putative solute:sodium symporter small subunit